MGDMHDRHLRRGMVVAVHVAAIPAEINDHAPFVCTATVIDRADPGFWWVHVNTPAGILPQMYRPDEILGVWWAAA